MGASRVLIKLLLLVKQEDKWRIYTLEAQGLGGFKGNTFVDGSSVCVSCGVHAFGLRVVLAPPPPPLLPTAV